jgi:hypothetical protein
MQYARACTFLILAACSANAPWDQSDAASPPSQHGDAAANDAAAPTTSDASAPPADSDGSASAPAPTATGCASLVHDGANVENSPADSYAWSDSSCRPRSASFFRNDQKDVFGESGGYLRSLSYEVNGNKRTARGTGSNGWQGFGYIVNHYANSASTTQGTAGKTTVALAGKHHAVHRYTWRVNPGGPVDVTAEWRVATGRDHPVFSITFDATAAGANVVNADTRAPYGDMAYEGTAGAISGIGWGDSYKFKTTASPVTTTTAWDYTQPNTIPYDVSWSSGGDAEMGLVATTDFASGMSGGDYGAGTLSAHWGKSGSNLLSDVVDWSWPYQLNQYELPFGTTSHRVAWGANYGAVGQSSYTSFGRKLSGYPTTSYAVRVVFGTHGASAVAAEVAEMETVMATKVTANAGTPKWDALRDAWSADATSNAVTLTIAAPSALRNPMFVIRNWTAGDPNLQWNGAALTADTHYYATVDSTNHELWITLAFSAQQGTLDVAP